MNAATRIDDSALFRRLDELSIDHRTHEHPPLRTVADSQALRGDLPGHHIKNLFLRDKKRRFFLVTVAEDRDVDLKALRRAIGAQGTLSFGNTESLMDLLGVEPGAVTPFGVINDTAGAVSAALDSALLGDGPLNAHPLRNDKTTAVAPEDLLRFMREVGHDPMILDFDAME